MAKFRFKLASLYKLREIQRDEARLKLAEAVHAQQILEDQIIQVARDIERLQGLRRKVVSGSVDVELLLEAQRYHSVLIAQQNTMHEQQRLLAAEVERRQQAVVEADRQVKSLDKLRERKLGEFQREQHRIETKVLDELGATRCHREVTSWQS